MLLGQASMDTPPFSLQARPTREFGYIGVEAFCGFGVEALKYTQDATKHQASVPPSVHGKPLSPLSLAHTKKKRKSSFNFFR